MKQCRFCAEEIQDAAIVCKHCGRDLTESSSKRSHTLRNILLVVGLLLIVAFAGVYFGPEHQRYLEFDRMRAAWHMRCDRYRGVVTGRDAEAARICNQQLQELIAYGRAQGWE